MPTNSSLNKSEMYKWRDTMKKTDNVNYSKSRKGINVTEEENKIFNYGLTNVFQYKDEMWKKWHSSIKVFFLSNFNCILTEGHGSRRKDIADSVVKTAFVNPLKWITANWMIPYYLCMCQVASVMSFSLRSYRL